MNIEKLDCGCEYQVSGDKIKVRLKTKTCKEHTTVVDLVKQLQNLKDAKINEIKGKTNEIITAKYGGYWNQFNIVNSIRGYTTTDKTNYKTFVNDIISQELSFTDQVLNMVNLEEIQNFNYEFIIGG